MSTTLSTKHTPATFINPVALFTRPARVRRTLFRRPSFPIRGLRVAVSSRRPLFMAASGPGSAPEGADADADTDARRETLMEKEASESPYSVWGVSSFVIIFLIFLISIFATLARDFVPGGMVGPA